MDGKTNVISSRPPKLANSETQKRYHYEVGHNAFNAKG